MSQTIATNPFNGLFDFGPVDSDDIRLSFEGLAVRRGEDYFMYDAEEKQLKQVFNFMTIQTGQPMAWKIPTKIERLTAGDLFMYNNTLYYVINNEVTEKNCIATFNMTTHRNSSLNVAQNPLGMRMVTKIATLADSFDDDMMPLLMMGGMGQQPGAQAGGMNPLMMLMLMKDKGEDKGKIDPMMLMMMSGMGGQGGQDMGMLPLMLLMKDGDEKSDMKNMMMMAMMGGMNGQAGAQAGGMNPMMAMMMMKNL